MSKHDSTSGIVVGTLDTPMLIELCTDRWIEALGALKLAGFRIVSTPHGKRLRVVDEPRLVIAPVNTLDTNT